VEHDPNQIYLSVIDCIYELQKKHSLTKANVKAIGITNQRETTVAFNAKSGQSLSNAIVWLDSRTQGVVKEMTQLAGGDKDAYRKDVGLPINTYFSAVKMKWMLENVEAVRAAASEGTLRFGTIDTWLIHVRNHSACVLEIHKWSLVRD